MSQAILWPGSGPGPNPPAKAAPRAKTPAIAWLSPLLALAVVAGVLWHDGHLPSLRPEPPGGVALGRSFAPLLAGSLADGFDRGAELIEQGKPVKDADEALKTVFLEAREKAFKEKAAPAFEAIVPSGADPKDDAARKAYAVLFRDFAKGLRRGK